MTRNRSQSSSSGCSASDSSRRAARLTTIAEHLRETAKRVQEIARRHGDGAAVSALGHLAQSIDRERIELQAIAGDSTAAPKPDPTVANTEPHDQVEEADMESFPASDPPSTRHHTD